MTTATTTFKQAVYAKAAKKLNVKITSTKELKKHFPSYNFRQTQDWVELSKALCDLTDETEQVQETPEEIVEDLATESGGYTPIFRYREALPHMTREEQDQALYSLEQAGKIELSALQEVRNYSREQVEAGIPQDIGGCLFFIQTEEALKVA